jgi:hypothetical protein
MFIATMFSYGKDPHSVGVDGIRSCMGVFLAYQQMLYAIHVPQGVQARLDEGRTKFASYVKEQIPALVGKNAQLFSVVNGKERATQSEEMQTYCKELGVGRVTLVQLDKELGVQPLYHDAAAVLCEFIHGTDQCRLKYQRADDVKFEENALGTPSRAGYYFNNSFDKVLSTPTPMNTSPSKGWNVVSASNSTIVVNDFA